MSESELYLQRLVDSNALREPVMRAMIEGLTFPEGSMGLDAGCGVGLQALLLAEAVGPHGHVAGLDQSPTFLSYGEALARARGLADRVSFREGDVRQLPFDDNSFDWLWSVDCVGYPAGDMLPILREATRVVKPGGTVAIMAWTAQCVLPGYPLLEARLNATCSAFTPCLTGQPPDAHFLRALRWFREAGMEEVAGRTFVGEVQAPLRDDVRKALLSLFQMLWVEPVPELAQEDWIAYQRLCDPGSAEHILNLPDYYAFFTYTLFRGTVPHQHS